jgi:ribosome-interacting GTPase 1
MSANLPPAYHKAEERYREASTPEEKKAALEEMLRLIPKHKGTEKLQASIRSRISKLKREPTQKGVGRSQSHAIPREGAAQIVLVGPPNSGKSSLVDGLTHATPKVADYPFTTREAVPGMAPYEDIAFQLIDLPPLSDEHIEPWVFDLVRAGDMIWVVVEQSNSLDGLELVDRLLREKHIEPVPWGATPTEEDARGWVQKKSLLVVTGADKPESADDLEILRELLEKPWPIFPVSSVDGRGVDDLKKACFEALEVIRVYTKRPGKPADREQPFALTRGATVRDLTETIHRELVEEIKTARVWGEGVFDGQTVPLEHVLSDGDVVELHM